MTETEWLKSRNILAMLSFLGDSASGRKLRLFACACCRRWQKWLMGCGHRAIQAVERYADGLADRQELAQIHEETYECIAHIPWMERREFVIAAAAEAAGPDPFLAACCSMLIAIPKDNRPPVYVRGLPAEQRMKEHVRSACVTVRNWAASSLGWWSRYRLGVSGVEMQSHADLLRDIFLPFHAPQLDSSCLTDNVRRIAETIYHERQFADMPILGDALEEAGCTDEHILSHCRGSGPHTRGCWLVDLLIGKG
jgi:hypothetical protein